MDAKILAFCASDSNFKNNTNWTSYKNAVYLNVEFARPRIDTFQDINEDSLKNRTVTFQRQRVEQSFFLPVRSYLVDFFSTLGFNDTVLLYILETNEAFQLSNVVFADNGDAGAIVAASSFTFDITSITGSGCDDMNYETTPC
jgi:hypothetical protein